jgi:hypothetical protein
MKYICVTPCIVHSRRFKRGQELPSHLIPEGEPKWLHHFEPEETAKNTIQKKRLIELGVDPEREKVLRAKIQNVKGKMSNEMKIEPEPEGERINFSTITNTEAEKIGKGALAGTLKTMGIAVNPNEYSVNDLLEIGRDAVAAPAPKRKPGRPKGSTKKK